MHALLADLILALHAAVVAFVIGVELLVLLGGRRGWRWIRNRALRIVHLALIGFVAVQSWLGDLCPLTEWEMALRARAGQPTHDLSFIEYWLSRLLYVDAPWWTFVLGYTLFGLLVLASWWWVPPRPPARRPR